MTTPLEARLSEVLSRHAEDAMRQTDTLQEQQELMHRVRREGRRRGRVIAGVAAAAAAATIAVWAGGLGETTGPEPVEDVPSESEQVAQDVVDAYAEGDGPRLAAYLGSTQALADWRAELRRDRAWDITVYPEPCVEIYTNPQGAQVGCPFSYHAFGSERLGLGPFGQNVFKVTVERGRVTAVDVSYNSAGNGEAELFDAIGAWVEEHSPADWALMETPDPAPAEQARWLRLWDRWIEEYVDAHTS
jgi:hypothetical protein